MRCRLRFASGKHALRFNDASEEVAELGTKPCPAVTANRQGSGAEDTCREHLALGLASPGLGMVLDVEMLQDFGSSYLPFTCVGEMVPV